MRQLVIDSSVDAVIRRHGEQTYPHECCGALIGRGDRVDAAVELPNTTEEGPRRRFLVSDRDYKLSEQRASELGGELVGFYHSHPDHPNLPSDFDREWAQPHFSYLITSVDSGLSLIHI